MTLNVNAFVMKTKSRDVLEMDLLTIMIHAHATHALAMRMLLKNANPWVILIFGTFMSADANATLNIL